MAQRLEGQLAIGCRQSHRSDHTQRRRFRGRCQTGVDRTDDNEEDSHRRHQPRQGRDAIGPGYGDGFAAPGASVKASDDDGDHEQASQNQAGQKAGEVKLWHGGVGQQAVNDQTDGGRDKDTERASGRDGPEKKRLVVAALLDLGQRDGPDCCRRRDARTRCRGKKRARADIGVHEPTGQPGEPLGHAVIHPLRNARPQEQLAHQNEHRNGDQEKIRRVLPNDIAQCEVQGHWRVHMAKNQPQPAQRRRDRYAETDKHQKQNQCL